MYASVYEQLTEAGVDFRARSDPKLLTLNPGRGLSPRMIEKIREDTEFVLAATQDALARGDIRHIRYEIDELLKMFQINLDPSSEAYLKLSRAQLKQCNNAIPRGIGLIRFPQTHFKNPQTKEPSEKKAPFQVISQASRPF